MILFKTIQILSILQFRKSWTTVKGCNIHLALIETCLEKKYSKEKISLKDTEQKIDNQKLSVTNKNFQLFSTLIQLILRQKSKRKETESPLKSQGIVKSNTSKNSNKKIKNFNKKLTKLKSKIKSWKNKC